MPLGLKHLTQGPPRKAGIVDDKYMSL